MNEPNTQVQARKRNRQATKQQYDLILRRAKSLRGLCFRCRTAWFGVVADSVVGGEGDAVATASTTEILDDLLYVDLLLLGLLEVV